VLLLKFRQQLHPEVAVGSVITAAGLRIDISRLALPWLITSHNFIVPIISPHQFYTLGRGPNAVAKVLQHADLVSENSVG